MLREAPPKLDARPDATIIEYGLVVDADGDRVADCQIGINNDAPNPGDYRVWVKNLRTGVTDERVGPPYGIPDRVQPILTRQPTTPTERLDTCASTSSRTRRPVIVQRLQVFRSPSANFYAWASVTEDGRVTAWDYAPDAAWLAPS